MHASNWFVRKVFFAASSAVLFLTTAALATPPTCIMVDCPTSMYNNCTVYPVASSKGVWNDLAHVAIQYSWDNSTWTTAYTNNSPYNGSEADATGANIYTSSSTVGTLYVRAVATDTASQSTTSSVSSISIASCPSTNGMSWLNSVSGTYNYGSAWMYDTIAGQEKFWWTSGQRGYGDTIYYQAIYSGSPSAVVQTNHYGLHNESDVTVIRGSFSYGGSSYSYAMFLAEGDNTGSQPYVNDIGECFSNDGVTWTTPTPVVYSTQTNPSVNTYYGAGYPSAFHIGSNYYLILQDLTVQSSVYTIKCYLLESSDGVTWPAINPGTTQEFDLSSFTTHPVNAAKWAFYNDTWYMNYTPTNARSEVWTIPADATTHNPSGTTWTNAYNQTEAGLNDFDGAQGFRRDENGYLNGGGGAGTVAICWSASNNSSDASGPDGWFWAEQIWYACLTSP